MSTPPDDKKRAWLPEIGTWQYYAMLGAIAIFVLGPLGGVTAAYMNFSLGFFVGGQVLAGILGSAVTYGYGSEGKHGANYMQTMAASVAGMSGMAVLVQAAVWLGLPMPPWWALSLYFGCIGMFGVGLGMLYTPLLVDRMQLTFPSGMAVANILRALTDKKLLQASISKLGSGTFLGILGGLASNQFATLGDLGLSTSTIGAGMVVGARITVPAVVVALIGSELTPYLVGDGVPEWPAFLDRFLGPAPHIMVHWLDPGAPFRKIGFIIALGTILGAALIDLSIVAYKTVGEFGKKKEVIAGEEWKQTNTTGLFAWVAFWGVATFLVATVILGLPAKFVLIAMALVLVFLIINGISTGISDSNPISSAFVISVFVMGFAGLTDPAVGLMCASILLIATSVGVDMQQDRSTGWRLGTNRTIQFRYQVVGVVMGAVMSVMFAKVFMAAYPVLTVNQFQHSHEVAAIADAQEQELKDEEARAEAAAEKTNAGAQDIASAVADARTELRGVKEALATGGSLSAVDAAPFLGRADAALDRARAAALTTQDAASHVLRVEPIAPDPALAAAAAQQETDIKRWQSAMTFKFVGALSDLAHPQQRTKTALTAGVLIGFTTELLRKILRAIPAYKAFVARGKMGFATDFVVDAVLLPSPYASSFGGFVDFATALWFAVGGILTSFASTIEDEATRPYKAKGVLAGDNDIPEDMSTTSLVGGGLIAGDSLAALAIGIYGLISALLSGA